MNEKNHVELQCQKKVLCGCANERPFSLNKNKGYSLKIRSEAKDLDFFEFNLKLTPVRQLQENAMIYSQGEPSKFLYLVESGSVRVCRVTVGGRRQVCSFYVSGEMFGFDGSESRQSYAEALEASGVRALKLTDNVRRSDAIMRSYLAHLERMEIRNLDLLTGNAIERLGRFLVDLALRQETADIVTLPMCRLDIAEHIDLTLETVSRSMHRLQKLKMIEILSARKIKLDLPVLSSLLEN